MAKNILILKCSPRSGGNSDTLADFLKWEYLGGVFAKEVFDRGEILKRDKPAEAEAFARKL